MKLVTTRQRPGAAACLNLRGVVTEFEQEHDCGAAREAESQCAAADFRRKKRRREGGEVGGEGLGEAAASSSQRTVAKKRK